MHDAHLDAMIETGFRLRALTPVRVNRTVIVDALVREAAIGVRAIEVIGPSQARCEGKQERSQGWALLVLPWVAQPDLPHRPAGGTQPHPRLPGGPRSFVCVFLSLWFMMEKGIPIESIFS